MCIFSFLKGSNYYFFHTIVISLDKKTTYIHNFGQLCMVNAGSKFITTENAKRCDASTRLQCCICWLSIGGILDKNYCNTLDKCYNSVVNCFNSFSKVVVSF